jgi:inner membrane protein
VGPQRQQRQLRIEDFALLVGSLGLLALLAVIMFLTRKVDWYGHVE